MNAIFIGGVKHGHVEPMVDTPSRLSVEVDGHATVYKLGPTFARGADSTRTEVWHIIEGMTLEEAHQELKSIRFPRIG